MKKRIFQMGAGWLWLACLSLCVQAAELDEQTRVQLEALNRLKGMDLEANPGLKGAVLKVVEKTRGTAAYVELVRDFGLKGQGAALMEYALAHPGESSGVEAFRMAITEDREAVTQLLRGTNGVPVALLLGNAGSREAQELLEAVVVDENYSPEVRKEAVRGLARNEKGAGYLLALARDGTMPGVVRLTASEALNRAPWPAVREEATALLPLPQGGDAEPLPPVSELAKRTGNAVRGREIFFSATAACSSCHQVNGQGTEFGPALSEIGTKLGKEALYEAILDPSSGVSFGYEAWSIELANGDEAYGLITSETAESLSVKTQGGIVTEYRKDQIRSRRKSQTSAMPAGLQLTMSAEELVDLVEYLASLQKR